MPKIFISYRRADSRKDSGRIYDRLVRAFGKDNIFKDVDNIPLGKDFRGVLREAVANCDVLLVMIGKQWLNIQSDDGTRRLDNPNDFVRIEIESGLQRDNCLVIPVLVDNAPMPNSQDLPPSLRELAFKNATIVRDDPDFHKDVDRIIRSLQREYQSAQESHTDKPDKTHSETNIPFVPIMIGAVVILAIIGIAGLALSSQSTDDPTQTPTTQTVATESTNESEPATESDLSEEDVRATGAAQAYETLTALAPTETPTITPTPTETPISASDIQKTAQAEIFATETVAVQTLAVLQQQTQNAVLTEQFIAGSTATFIAQLSLTPPATDTLEPTNTPIPPTPTFTPVPPTPTSILDMPEAERVALEGVTSNVEWENIVGDEGYVREFNGVEMVLVPSGCFVMGNDPDAGYWDLGQSEWVTGVPGGEQQCFDKPFWVDKTEVTQADFERLGGVQADPPDFDGENRPVEDITWFEARDFCALRGGRLPTEAEWEYVARGPNELYFPWGNEWNENNAVWNRGSSQGTAEVGSISAGASWVGALDMSGNVWEWTRSIYEDYPYVASDGREADLGDETDVLYSLRGGSWLYYNNQNLRSATRNRNIPYLSGIIFGFRCVLSYE